MTTQHDNPINAPTIIVLLIAAMVFLGGVVVPGVIALNDGLERALPTAGADQPYAELASHRLKEQARIGSYRWIDEKNHVAAVPIDQAIALYAQRQTNAEDK